MSKPICNTPTGARCPGDGVTECKKCPAEHVPPAGVEPEVVGYRCRQSETEKWHMSSTPAYWEHQPVILLEEHRAHVTQLKAEVTEQALCAASEARRALHAESELTKARELLIPAECPHMIVFDDADRETLMFAGEGARTAALKTWEQISGSWNAHLFVRVERNSRDDRYPSANQSAPADKNEECVHDFRMFSGECHKCGADWIPGK